MKGPQKSAAAQPDAAPPGGITGRRLQALELIATGAGDAEVSRELKVPRSTVWRWKQDDDFAAALRAITDEQIDTGRQRLARLVSRAVDFLDSVLGDTKVPAWLRMRAAEQILDRAGVVAPTRVHQGSGTAGAVESLSDAELVEEYERLQQADAGVRDAAQEGA